MLGCEIHTPDGPAFYSERGPDGEDGKERHWVMRLNCTEPLVAETDYASSIVLLDSDQVSLKPFRPSGDPDKSDDEEDDDGEEGEEEDSQLIVKPGEKWNVHYTGDEEVSGSRSQLGPWREQ